MSHKFGFLTSYEVVEISRKINMLKFLLVPAQLLPYIYRLLPLFNNAEMKHLKAEKKTYKRRYNYFCENKYPWFSGSALDRDYY